MVKAQVQMETFDGSESRLQKVLALAGVGSRRACEELIAAGRVSVDGETVTRQGVRVDPERVVVRVDGERVITAKDRRYLLLNKPLGVVSTMSDERGRASLADLLPSNAGRLFHVGRLDADTEGLLILTNDGELSHRLMHPSFTVSKTYLATVNGPVPAAVRRLLKQGVLLDDGPASVDAVRQVDSVGNRTLLEIRVHEGRKHLVRRMLAAVEHPVQALVRVQLGSINLGDLKSGRTRPLSRQEVSSLYDLVDLQS